MDTFKRFQSTLCGQGGLKCSCCNDFKNGKKEKRILNKIARRKFKIHSNKMILEY